MKENNIGSGHSVQTPESCLLWDNNILFNSYFPLLPVTMSFIIVTFIFSAITEKCIHYDFYGVRFSPMSIYSLLLLFMDPLHFSCYWRIISLL